MKEKLQPLAKPFDAPQRARDIVVDYELHCESIDDPDPAWLEGRLVDELKAAADLAASGAQRLTAEILLKARGWSIDNLKDVSVRDAFEAEAEKLNALLLAAPAGHAELSEEQVRLLKLGHCPWDVEPEDEGDPLPEPHCHANRDGECNFAYCPQPLLRSKPAVDKKRCVGFPGCDGNLPGEEHSEKCPMRPAGDVKEGRWADSIPKD